MPGAVPKRGVSWGFDLAVVLSGLVLAVVGVVELIADISVFSAFALLVGAPLCALMARFPLLLGRASGGIEVGFESAVLIFLACVHGGDGALGIWALGQLLSQGTSSKRVDVRAFNVGLSVTAGFCT